MAEAELYQKWRLWLTQGVWGAGLSAPPGGGHTVATNLLEKWLLVRRA